MAEEKENKKKSKRPTAQKRDIQNEKKRLRNRAGMSQIKTALRSFSQSEGSAEALSKVYSLLDKGVKKGIIKLNQANRVKSKVTLQSK